MNNSEYAKYVGSLTARSEDFNKFPPKTIHALIGLATELGEMFDILKKTGAYGRPLDVKHLKEEAGDLLHYLQMLCNDQGWSLEDLMEDNCAKLRVRYPDGFTKAAAIARADKNVAGGA